MPSSGCQLCLDGGLKGKESRDPSFCIWGSSDPLGRASALPMEPEFFSPSLQPCWVFTSTSGWGQQALLPLLQWLNVFLPIEEKGSRRFSVFLGSWTGPQLWHSAVPAERPRGGLSRCSSRASLRPLYVMTGSRRPEPLGGGVQ